MDIADHAERTESFLVEQQIANAKRGVGREVRKPRGACFFCDEPLAGEQIFCDDDCKEDFDKLKRAERFNRG